MEKLSEYEQLRRRGIAQNNAHLESLGLGIAPPPLSESRAVAMSSPEPPAAAGMPAATPLDDEDVARRRQREAARASQILREEVGAEAVGEPRVGEGGRRHLVGAAEAKRWAPKPSGSRALAREVVDTVGGVISQP